MSDDRARNLADPFEVDARRHPLVTMQFALLTRLDEARARKDKAAQAELARELAVTGAKVSALERDYRAAMAAACKTARAERNDDVRVEKLLDAFELCAQTQALALEAFMDKGCLDIAIKHKRALVADLAAMKPDRLLALGKFLDHPVDNVRASAAAHLHFHELMCERTLAMLNDIAKNSKSIVAHMTAKFAITPAEWRNPPGGEDVAERNDFPNPGY
jgi:hypothetical protein